jgi:hypothetical protein
MFAEMIALAAWLLFKGIDGDQWPKSIMSGCVAE